MKKGGCRYSLVICCILILSIENFVQRAAFGSAGTGDGWRLGQVCGVHLVRKKCTFWGRRSEHSVV